MDPNNNEERVCPRCTGIMVEQNDGTFKCMVCGFVATENALENGVETRD